jgi:hypothetical protein
MDINQINHPLSQFVEKLPKSIKVDQVIIFGSHLEGKATEESDIDVLVISNDFQRMDEDTRLDILYDAAKEIEPEIHPWGFTAQELKKASRLTPLGYVRDAGIRFV